MSSEFMANFLGDLFSFLSLWVRQNQYSKNLLVTKLVTDQFFKQDLKEKLGQKIIVYHFVQGHWYVSKDVKHLESFGPNTTIILVGHTNY